MSVVLRELKPDDSSSGFSLGDAQYTPLKIFLRKHAKDYHLQNIAKTYVLVSTETATIVGYVSIVCSQIELTGKNAISGVPYPGYPCIKIARLAVDKAWKDEGLGTMLVDWSISITKTRIMPYVGCRFIVVDSKASSIPFYEKCGFTLLDTEANKNAKHPVLFIDLHKTESQTNS